MAAVLSMALSVGANAQQANTIDVIHASAEYKVLTHMIAVNGLTDYYHDMGGYTLFAPSDAAMAKLPAYIVQNMQLPQYSQTTQSIINYHILPGKITQADIVNAIKKGDGRAVFTTIQGGKLFFTTLGNYIKVTDEEGHTGNIRFSGLTASNGIVHTIDMVMMPRDEPATGVAAK